MAGDAQLLNHNTSLDKSLFNPPSITLSVYEWERVSGAVTKP